MTVFNKAAFDKAGFEARLAVSLDAIKGAEAIVRAEVRVLSRSVLEALHITENVGYVNSLLSVLTPINKKAMIVFFQAFSGFHYDSKSETFTKKDKQTYDDKEKASLDFLEDPMNNFWSWAQREIKVEAKEFDMTVVTKNMENLLKKAAKNKFTQVDVLRAILKAGITADSILAVMDDLGFDVVEEEGQPQRPASKANVVDVLAREVINIQ